VHEDRLLDAFAGRAAHGLGTGLGIASGYAALLQERHGDALGADGMAVVAGLEGGLGRVRLFADDLLELAALDRRPVEPAPMRPAAAARVAAAGLAATLDGSAVEVDIATLPDLVADRALIERLFHHLLRAAIAAIGPGPGRVAVTGVRRASDVRIEVSDDGPGLGVAAARTLFEPFGSPRGAGPLAGAGVSMAICRRIAERHGGSIWARSGRRDGCTIVVQLPEPS
jgi:signal transduction histidine kinase